MKHWKLRCDSTNPRHTQFTLFDSYGANCGTITIQTSDVQYFLRWCWSGEVDFNNQPGKAPQPKDKHDQETKTGTKAG